MKIIASLLATIAVLSAAVAPASAADCTKALSKGGAKAFFACLDRERN